MPKSVSAILNAKARKFGFEAKRLNARPGLKDYTTEFLVGGLA